MKTKVRILNDDKRYQRYEKDETGYIDGYLRGGDDVPYAVVVIEKRKCLLMINLDVLEVIKNE